MAENLQDTISRISNKMAVLMERHSVVEQKLKDAEDEIKQKEAENAKLMKEIERLTLELQYLKVARTISRDPEDLAKSKAILVQLVRDVDKCIAQLNE